MKLLGSSKSNTIKDENGENVPYVEITEVVSIHFNINISHQQNSRVLYRFVPNKSFGELLHISTKIFFFFENI